jgi:hypothetical protein
MCNPRRVTIQATRELDEAWQREVTRGARLSAQVAGEARLRQPLGDSISSQALAALETALAEDGAWQRQDDGSFRHEVEGGYVVYHPEERDLEIVAIRTTEVEASAETTELLAGRVTRQLEAQGLGDYYDDEWGGNTRQRAEDKAQRQVRARLDDASQEALRQAAESAENAAAAAVQERADAAARAELEATAAVAQARLAEEARGRLQTVGLRCRQVFHQVLARAYRDALLAYARRQGAEITTNEDNAGILEIELRWQG